MWVDSKTAAGILGVNLRTLQRKVINAQNKGQKILTIDTQKIMYQFIFNNRGGSNGKVLQIWLDDEIERENYENKQDNRANALAGEQGLQSGYSLYEWKNEPKSKETWKDESDKGIEHEEDKGIFTQVQRPSAHDGVFSYNDLADRHRSGSAEIDEIWDSTNMSDDKKAAAILKLKIVRMWLNIKKKSKKIDDFLGYINSINLYPKKLSKGLLYDWVRRYENGGIKGLVDERGGNKPLLVETLGYKSLVDELITASQGKISAYNIYNRLHHHFIQEGLITHDEFIGKQKYIVAYDSINRYVNKWKKENQTATLYIQKGYDGAVNSKLAAIGKADWKATFVNEYVEIDATTLDMFAKKINLDLAGEIYKMNKSAFKDLDECKERVAENQKRYTVVGMIDVFSGVCSYHIGKSENIYSVKRCLAKYIAKFGKPITVVGDNGKAFKSHEMQGTFDSLDIAYQAVRAYSGWLKPYIERSWRSFQDNFSQNLAGFIGHSVVQRQAIEFGFSKQERRLKKGEQTNLKRMHLINDLEKLMDEYIETHINTRWLDRLGCSPIQKYNSNIEKVAKIDERVVAARLGDMKTKKVYKKGIMEGGAYYVCPKVFEYDEAKIVPNINNTDEIYIWNNEGIFVGIGVRLNEGNGVSAEIAREARNYSKRKIDKTRKIANTAVYANQDSFVTHMKNCRPMEVGSAATKLQVELGEEISIAHKKAKSLKVMSVNLIQSKPKKEINISWEGLAKGK